MKTTDWFPADIKPVHIGYYETKTSTGIESKYRWWWNGIAWYFEPDCKSICQDQNRIWRGIAFNPFIAPMPMLSFANSDGGAY